LAAASLQVLAQASRKGKRHRLDRLGMAPLPTTPKRLQTLVRSELAAYGEVIKRAAIKLE